MPLGRSKGEGSDRDRGAVHRVGNVGDELGLTDGHLTRGPRVRVYTTRSSIRPVSWEAMAATSANVGALLCGWLDRLFAGMSRDRG